MNTMMIDAIRKVLENDSRLIDKGINTKNIFISNQNIESDLLWIVDDNGVTKHLIIEVKPNKSIIDVHDLVQLTASLSQIKDSERNAILVYSHDITKTAMQYAQKNNLIVLKAQQITDADWDGKIKQINVNMKMVLPSFSNYKFNFNVEKALEMLEQSGKPELRFNFSGLADQLNFLTNDHETISLQSILEHYHQQVTPDDYDTMKHITHVFEKTVMLESEIGNLEVNSIEFDMKVDVVSHPIAVDGTKNLGFAFGFTIVKAIISFDTIPVYMDVIV